MTTPDLVLYLGGTRCGKSALAEERVRQTADGSVLYVATAESLPGDDAMAERIRRHRARRPAHWQTLECPLRIGERLGDAIQTLPAFAGRPTILLDCVTLWVSNILFSLPQPEKTLPFENAVRAEIEALIALIRSSACRWILVSGEIGLGGIEPARLGRIYADGLGLANQMLAAEARAAFLIVAGCPLKLK